MQSEHIDQNTQMGNDQPQPITTIEISPQPSITIVPTRLYSCFELANIEIDRVTDHLYDEILQGQQRMKKRRPITLNQDEKSPQKKKKKSPQVPINIDQHKKKIRKFMWLHKKSVNYMEKHSMEMQQAAIKQRQQAQRRRNQERNQTLQSRRSQISSRMKGKEQMLQSLRRQLAQSNRRFSTVKSSTFLYQQKEQLFKKQFILPKIQQQKRIIKKKRDEMRRPIDMSALLQHEKQYEQKRMSDRINRSLTSRVLRSQNYYQAPKFIPKAFIISQAEHQLKRQQQKLREQETEVNEFRKKEFIKLMEQKQKFEVQKMKERSLQKSRSGNSLDKSQKREGKKDKPKPKPKPEEVKNLGNEYMKELIKMNKNRRRKTSVQNMSEQKQTSMEKSKTFVPKTQQQIEEIREQKIQMFQKLRLRKIDSILGDNRIGKQFKLQRLHHQVQKIDNLVSLQSKMKAKPQDSSYTMLVLSSIQTKLAILQVSSPNRHTYE